MPGLPNAKQGRLAVPVALALFQPDIPQNTGTMLRLCACLGAPAHLIHPAGFVMTDKSLKRAGMDYLNLAQLTEHDSFATFDAWRRRHGHRLVLLTTKARQSVYDADFAASDILMVGRESAGVPDKIADTADLCLRLPMQQDARALNVAVAAAMGLGEALRQTDGLPKDARTANLC